MKGSFAMLTREDAVKVVRVGTRTFCYGGAGSIVSGVAVVPKTILWGLVTTGTAVSWPVVLGLGFSAAAVAMAAQAVITVRRNRSEERELGSML